MPLPLKKLKKLAANIEVAPVVDMLKVRRRSTISLWVAMENGKVMSPIFDNVDQVLRHMGSGSYTIQKLHPQGDSELISKIKKKYNV